MPKSSSAILIPLRRSCWSTSRAISPSSIRRFSVTSRTSVPGSSPLSATTASTSATKPGDISWWADTLTDRSTGEAGWSRRHRVASRQARTSTQRPTLFIRPLRSAISTMVPAGTGPCSGWSQRTRALDPADQPVAATDQRLVDEVERVVVARGGQVAAQPAGLGVLRRRRAGRRSSTGSGAASRRTSRCRPPRSAAPRRTRPAPRRRRRRWRAIRRAAPPTVNGGTRACWIRSVSTCTSDSSARSSQSSTNSSPYSRANVSPGPHHAGQPAGHVAQQLVAGLVAVVVVDQLEPVEVDEDQGRVRPGPLGPAAGLLDPLLEQQPVGQAGQRVVHGQVLEPGGAVLGVLPGPGVQQVGRGHVRQHLGGLQVLLPELARGLLVEVERAEAGRPGGGGGR